MKSMLVILGSSISAYLIDRNINSLMESSWFCFMHYSFALFQAKEAPILEPPPLSLSSVSFLISPWNDLFPSNFAREIDVDSGPLLRLVSPAGSSKSLLRSRRGTGACVTAEWGGSAHKSLVLRHLWGSRLLACHHEGPRDTPAFSLIDSKGP